MNRSKTAPRLRANNSQTSRSCLTGCVPKHGWGLLLIVIVAAVVVNLGALDWYTGDTIVASDGSTLRLPNTFASIDHPFHISKERTVLDAIRDGNFPRWIANHQGGYPVEFYPLGADLIVAAFWAAGFGLIPLEVVHKLVVIAILCIPAAGYWAMARRDNLSGGIAVTATLLHLFIPGSWMAGGPDELLRMGMWPNVFATYLTLPLLLFASDYLRFGRGRHLALSVGVASLAIYTNPRSTIAIGTVLLAVVIVTTLGSEPRVRASFARLFGLRLAIIAVLTGLLCSALLIPLRARQHEYEFLRFVEFDQPGKFREYLGGAMPWEIVALGLVGMVLAWRSSGYFSRIVALWFPLGLGVIILSGWALRDLSIFAQLEGPRLIPILRLPLVFLAAVAIHRLASMLTGMLRSRQSLALPDLVAVAVTALVVLTPISTLSAGKRGLPEIETTDAPAFAAIATAAEAYESISSPEDRALIIGSPISDHASFWVPALTGANAFHAAWIWYWKTPAYADRTMIDNIDRALDLDFLQRHGLTFVMIATSEPEQLALAKTLEHLEPVEVPPENGYIILRVTGAESAGLVSVSKGTVNSVETSREHLRASVQSDRPVTVRIAINDYPAWSATVNGIDTTIRRDTDGYMLIDIPAGGAEIELSFTIEPIVWLGRVLTTLGIVFLIAMLVLDRRHRPVAAA